MSDTQRPTPVAVPGADKAERMVTVALDAMGADFDPGAAIEAASMALQRDASLRLRLVANPARVDETRLAALGERCDLVRSAEFVAMTSSPAEALRHGRKSSMALTLAEVVAGRADAAVSAGNTGALMALARAALGMLPGIERPALMTEFPVRGGSAWVLDLGANIGVDAARLVEFAVLGNAAVGALLQRPPRVGLLNIGREPNKGPDVIREAARRLGEAQAGLDFIGFVEGHDVFGGGADLVVCDGFAGNILLKSAEGAIAMLLAEVERGARPWWSGPALRGLSRELTRRYDPQGHNGASLLGVDGIVIKSHAHASVEGLAHALEVAAQEVRRGMLKELERQLWAMV
ncbi:MAG: phosphate acyltransferase PlsX [Gammaproteobacteria bacterium HGW-Gammaproteobacteria-8]|nr:MAG: phosphate acyltransferase PlsX [Gammaproteobacteria bacterium HGW-Gammaproteobacteria-8]